MNRREVDMTTLTDATVEELESIARSGVGKHQIRSRRAVLGKFQERLTKAGFDAKAIGVAVQNVRDIVALRAASDTDD